jgi:L-lactate dehydrogenase complex protein LldG
MTTARQAILSRIRQSLGREALAPQTIQTLEARLAQPPVHTQPTITQPLMQQFIEQLQKAAATCVTVVHFSEVPQCVLDFLTYHQLPKQVVIDAHLNALPWPKAIHIIYRPAQADDKVCINTAFAGVAETGNLVLLSNPANPTTLNFLAENHIVILPQAYLVAHLEAVWTRLRTQKMPRAVNFIRGPSRTADIEQTLQLGAHGPKQLHVILVEKEVDI